MIPEDRYCAFCPKKIDQSKRADARYCSHACKLAARRKEQREQEAARPTAQQPLAPSRALPAMRVDPEPQARSSTHPAPTSALEPRPPPLVAEFLDHPYVQHPTPKPLTLVELREVILMNAPDEATGYRLGIMIDTPEYGPLLHLYPSYLKVTRRLNGTSRSGGEFSLRPFEAPVIPRVGIYEVRYMVQGAYRVRGGDGVENGVHVQPYGLVANLRDGDRKRPKGPYDLWQPPSWLTRRR